MEKKKRANLLESIHDPRPKILRGGPGVKKFLGGRKFQGLAKFFFLNAIFGPNFPLFGYKIFLGGGGSRLCIPPPPGIMYTSQVISLPISIQVVIASITTESRKYVRSFFYVRKLIP